MRFAAIALLLASCGGEGSTGDAGTDGGAAITVTSTAFAEGGTIPIVHVCQPAGAYGTGTSPPLRWTGAPMGTQSYVLIVDDPDAGGWTHWLVYDIPAGTESVLANATPAGGTLGLEQNGMARYAGPCPPSGVHTYSFRVYALDTTTLALGPGATKAAVLAAMDGHVLASGELRGRVDAGIL